MAHDIRTSEVERSRNVLDVDRILPRGRLEAERAERLQIALESHEVEAPPELLRIARRGEAAVAKRKEERDQPVDLRLGEINVGVAQQRHEIVRVGSHPRVLEVDDVETSVVEHQVAAVIVAMAQHARVRRELLGDRGVLPGKRGPWGGTALWARISPLANVES